MMKGVQYVVDEGGEPTAVVIDLKSNSELWEDFHDRALAESRRNEPRESFESVKARLAKRRRSRLARVSAVIPAQAEIHRTGPPFSRG